MDEYIVAGTGYRLASFSILDVRAGLAKPLSERWIGHAPLNFKYLRLIFGTMLTTLIMHQQINWQPTFTLGPREMTEITIRKCI